MVATMPWMTRMLAASWLTVSFGGCHNSSFPTTQGRQDPIAFPIDPASASLADSPLSIGGQAPMPVVVELELYMVAEAHRYLGGDFYPLGNITIVRIGDWTGQVEGDDLLLRSSLGAPLPGIEARDWNLYGSWPDDVAILAGYFDDGLEGVQVGQGYAPRHPEVVATVVTSLMTNWPMYPFAWHAPFKHYKWTRGHWSQRAISRFTSYDDFAKEPLATLGLPLGIRPWSGDRLISLIGGAEPHFAQVAGPPDRVLPIVPPNEIGDHDICNWTAERSGMTFLASDWQAGELSILVWKPGQKDPTIHHLGGTVKNCSFHMRSAPAKHAAEGLVVDYGPDGHLAISDFNGTDWSRLLPTPMRDTTVLRSVAWLDQGDTLFVQSSRRHLWHRSATNDWTPWLPVPAPGDTAANHEAPIFAEAVWARAPGDIWVLGIQSGRSVLFHTRPPTNVIERTAFEADYMRQTKGGGK